MDPGESTTISTDFMMHEGMGGAHLFEIPVSNNDPTQPLKKIVYRFGLAAGLERNSETCGGWRIKLHRTDM
ncbi:hypothetical protein FBQ82_01140 [Anaerolineae bacterium CFX7]|nr:hypothetical protein [Anaerolineae bacterium CFX7]